MARDSNEDSARRNRSSGGPSGARTAGTTVMVPDGGGQGGAPRQPAPQKYCSNCGAALDQQADVCPQCGVRQDTGDDGGTTPTGRYMSGVVGALAAVFLGWLPLIGLIVGGAVAGYLRGSDNKESAISGLVAHVLASIPWMLLIGFFFVFGGIGVVASGEGGAALGLFIWAVIFIVGFVFYFAMGAVGGVLGAAITSRPKP